MERLNYTSFTDLQCWQKARILVKLIYDVTESSRDFALRDQIRRAAISVMNNIAEGYTRRSDKETYRFLDIAISSCSEVISMTYIFEDLEFCNSDMTHEIRSKSTEIYKMTSSLALYIHNRTK